MHEEVNNTTTKFQYFFIFFGNKYRHKTKRTFRHNATQHNTTQRNTTQRNTKHTYVSLSRQRRHRTYKNIIKSYR